MKNFIQIFLTVLIIILFQFSVSGQVIPVRVACVGNSITYGGMGASSYPQQLGKLLGSHYDVKNFGVSGTTMLKKGDFPYWKESFYSDAKDFIPNIVIIELGTNDSKPQNWTYKSEFYADYMDMVNEFRKVNPHMQVYVCLPPPVFKDGSGITNSIIRDQIMPLIDSVRKTAKTLMIDNNTPMLNMSANFPDGIHPDATGYLFMANTALAEINKSPTGFIRYFNAKPAVYEKGDAVKLYWETSAGTPVYINNTLVKDSDSMSVQPLPNAQYTLITKGIYSDTMKITLQYLAPGKIKSFSANQYLLSKDGGDTALLKWSATNGSTVTLNGSNVSTSGTMLVSPKTTTLYTLIAKGDITDTSKITIQLTESDKINRALAHTVKSSSYSKGYPPEFVVDGDTATYWQSIAANSQWLYIDLGKNIAFTRVVLRWGSVYARSYYLQSISEEGETNNIYENTLGDGEIDDIKGLTGEGRYLRLLNISKNSNDVGYILKEFEIYGNPKPVTAVSEENIIPGRFSLEQNYPNPFNPTTIISYSVPREGMVSLTIFDVLGKTIATIVNEHQNSGKHEVKFDAAAISSGIYFYKLSFENKFITKKLILLK